MHTPKSLGEKLGKVVKVEKDHFVIQTASQISNGDGLCYFDRAMKLAGLKADVVNGNRIFSNALIGLYAGATIYRNYDHAFNKELENNPSNRKISIQLLFSETVNGVKCQLKDEDGLITTIETPMAKEAAQKPEKALEQIKIQLSKWGNSPFLPELIKVDLETPLFIPVSVINGIRRELGEAHQNARLQAYKREEYQITRTNHAFPEELNTHESNVLNHLARAFYEQHSVKVIESGLELGSSVGSKRVMTTRHCIRYATDFCPRENPQAKSDDLIMKSGKNSFLLKFDCKKCEMQVFTMEKQETGTKR
jgi:putative protease